jgi:hypothetical protein
MTSSLKSSPNRDRLPADDIESGGSHTHSRRQKHSSSGHKPSRLREMSTQTPEVREVSTQTFHSQCPPGSPRDPVEGHLDRSRPHHSHGRSPSTASKHVRPEAGSSHGHSPAARHSSDLRRSSQHSPTTSENCVRTPPGTHSSAPNTHSSTRSNLRHSSQLG